MRLKSIKLAGFKSFVDPTSVNFPSNLCSVVGPNGCGKSNIIDAVRWVMGESSAKQLRGDSMTDVIFNGSSGRKPVGQASIELIFDNSSGRITGEYASYNEIAVKRVVTRDGTSDYYLNGGRCRRRDVTDVFLGTGLGPRSYSIIEQGMISNLITAKPEELRAYVEEAAGISKYKERRRDTENRIRRTRDNLERLHDIREELARQLGRLQRQSTAAEKYRELKATEAELKKQWHSLKWRDYDLRVTAEENKIKEQEVSLEKEIASDAGYESAIEELRAKQAQMNDTLSEIQGRFYALGSEIARQEQSIKHFEESRKQLVSDLEETERSYVETQDHIKQDKLRSSALEAELGQLNPQTEQAQKTAEGSATTLAAVEAKMQEWQTAWDEFQRSSSEARQQAEVQQSRIQHLERVIKTLDDRIQRLTQQRSAADEINPILSKLDKDSDVITQLKTTLDTKRKTEEELVTSIKGFRSELSEGDTQLHTARNELQNHRGRLASLEALQEAALGADQGELRDWIELAGIANSDRLVDQLDVESGWEKAVETVLDDTLQAISVDSLEKYSSKLESLKEGGLTLFESSGSADITKGTLAEKVENSELAAQLGTVYCAQDLADALAQRKKLKPHESVVTPEGIWIGPNWMRVQRGDVSGAGILQRKQEIASLLNEIEATATRETELVTARDQIARSLQQAEQKREQLRTETEKLSTELAEAESRKAAAEAKVESLRKQRDQIDSDIAEAQKQSEQEKAAVVEARGLLSTAIEQMDKDTRDKEQKLQQREQLRGEIEKARNSVQHDRNQAHQLAMRQQEVSTQLSALVQSAERLEQQLKRLQERRDALKVNSQEDDNPIDDMREKLQEKLAARLAVDTELQTARRAAEEVEQQLRVKEKQRHDQQASLQTARERIQDLRLAAQEVITLRKTVREQLGETDPEMVLVDIAEEATVSDWDRQLQALDARIQRLGPINLAAIDEYKIESERKSYLDSQNEELTKALETLENAIRKIDKETRTRFKETFDKINDGVKALFPRLFGGGHAYLELTGDDLLETGVTLMARPPGKRNSTIHLLSGGEKALTAIALVFSIFRLNPAPFCMLDEVDAPLDDANVARFARMVEEMSETVQFIVITHNKVSMEMSKQLMGVTMHEPGVSRLVTVDVEEAVELASA